MTTNLRRWTAAFVYLGVVLSGFALVDAPVSGQAPKPQDLRVAYSGERLSINGVNLDVPFERRDLVKILGTPSREKLDNRARILTWDELGISASVWQDSEKVYWVQVLLRKRAADTSPKNVFTGKAALEGTEVTADSTVVELNRNRKGNLLAKVGGSSKYWKSVYTSTSVYMETVDNGVGVVCFSIDIRKIKK